MRSNNRGEAARTDAAPRIVAAGELLWDLLPGGKQPGGAPANFVYHAAHNGAHATAVTAVGDDALGRELVGLLRASHVAVLAQVADRPTGVTHVSLEDGIPAYEVARDAAWDHIAYTPEVAALVSRADAVCYGSIAARMDRGTRQALYAMVDDAARHGAQRFFDVNIRCGFTDPAVIGRLLDGATIVKVNDEELPVLAAMDGLEAPGDDPAGQEATLRALMDRHGLDMAILTAGDRYSMVATPDATSLLETPKVRVADTVGAGDSFSGAFLARLLRGDTVRDAHRRAVDVAAHVCRHRGAWPPYLADDDASDREGGDSDARA